jgi:hypothetical protein
MTKTNQKLTISVSYFNHEALMKHHNLKCDFIIQEKLNMNIKQYNMSRDIYKPGLVNHGGYFQMLESGSKIKTSPLFSALDILFFKLIHYLPPLKWASLKKNIAMTPRSPLKYNFLWKKVTMTLAASLNTA